MMGGSAITVDAAPLLSSVSAADDGWKTGAGGGGGALTGVSTVGLSTRTGMTGGGATVGMTIFGGSGGGDAANTGG